MDSAGTELFVEWKWNVLAFDRQLFYFLSAAHIQEQTSQVRDHLVAALAKLPY